MVADFLLPGFLAGACAAVGFLPFALVLPVFLTLAFLRLAFLTLVGFGVDLLLVDFLVVDFLVVDFLLADTAAAAAGTAFTVGTPRSR